MLLYWGFREADANEVFTGKRELNDIAGNIPKPVQTGFEMFAQLKESEFKYRVRKRTVVLAFWLQNRVTEKCTYYL